MQDSEGNPFNFNARSFDNRNITGEPPPIDPAQSIATMIEQNEADEERRRQEEGIF